MKRKLFLTVLIVIILSFPTLSYAAGYLDPNRPVAIPPNQPVLQAPYDDPAVKMVCGDGCGVHTDSSATIKSYYARDYEKIGSDGYPTTFNVLAVADGKGWGVGTTKAKLTNILPQAGCPVDANLSNDTPDKTYDGNMAYIDHGNGWYSFYFHLDKVYITNNQPVKAGDVIGTAGCTGAQTIHLHYDLRWHDTTTNLWWDYPPSFSPPAPPDQKGVDLAFAIDTTGSMWDDIEAVKNAANDIVDYVFEAAPDSRIALVDFRDFPSRTGELYDYPYKDQLAFSGNKEDVKQAINSLDLGFGGDDPETRNCALMHVFNADNCAGQGFNTAIGPWRPIPNKFVIYLTDASALNPEPFTNFTNDIVTNAAKAGGFEVMGGDEDPTGYPDLPPTPYGIAVYPVIVGGDPDVIAEADEIATTTGGKLFTAADASEVAGSIIEAIQTIVEGPAAHVVDTTGVFRPSNGLLYLKNSNNTGFADIAINYGVPGDYPVVGDWDGNGTTTIGIYRNGMFYLRNENTIGFADLVFPFGQPGDQPVAGDWDGDGIDTVGIYRPYIGQFLLRNSNSAGIEDFSFYLGNVGDVGIAGDWDGDGKDTTGVFRPVNGIIFLKNQNTTGFADVALNYGIPGDKPVIGDWDGDSIDTIGVYRNGQFMLRNSNTVGFADLVFGLGNPGDMPIAGNWDGSIP